MRWSGRPRKRHWRALPLMPCQKMDKDITEVFVDRVGIRVGYFNEPHDIPEHELYDGSKEILNNKLYQTWGINNQLSGAQIYEIFGDIEGKCRYEARGNWLRKRNELLKKEGVDPNLRSLWFVWLADVDSEPERWLKVHKIKRHMLGIRYPASGDYEDYMPGGLAPQINQGFYYCNTDWGQAIMRNYEDYWDGPVVIHPSMILDYKT